MNPKNVYMIKTIAEGLGDKLKDFVFTGGSVMELYINDPAAEKPRATDDVDVVARVLSRSLYDDLENTLREKGFIDVMYEHAGRFKYKDVLLDVITTDQNAGGFTNIWYKDGYDNSIIVKVEDTEIKIFGIEYFIASKMEAFKGRGNNDLLGSHDMEDIIFVLNGRIEIEKDLQNAEKKVSEYLKHEFNKLLQNPSFPESVNAHIGYLLLPERTERLLNILKSFTQ